MTYVHLHVCTWAHVLGVLCVGSGVFPGVCVGGPQGVIISL